MKFFGPIVLLLVVCLVAFVLVLKWLHDSTPTDVPGAVPLSEASASVEPTTAAGKIDEFALRESDFIVLKPTFVPRGLVYDPELTLESGVWFLQVNWVAEGKRLMLMQGPQWEFGDISSYVHKDKVRVSGLDGVLLYPARAEWEGPMGKAAGAAVLIGDDEYLLMGVGVTHDQLVAVADSLVPVREQRKSGSSEIVTFSAEPYGKSDGIRSAVEWVAEVGPFPEEELTGEIAGTGYWGGEAWVRVVVSRKADSETVDEAVLSRFYGEDAWARRARGDSIGSTATVARTYRLPPDVAASICGR